MIQHYFKKYKILRFFITALMVFMFTAIVVASAKALTDITRPTIIEVSPANNGLSIATHDVILVKFSEPMDPRTINGETFTILQRTTPFLGSPFSAYRSTPLEGIVTYDDVTATFTPKKVREYPDIVQPSYNPMQPSQEFGNVFTVTITSGARDLAGNALSRNYLWSFTTGSNLFNTGTTTSQLDQSSTPVNGLAVIPAVPTSAVAAAPEATAYSFPWAWLIGGLIVLALIILIYLIAVKSSPQKNIHPVQATHSTPFGDVHPVIDIEGIGPEYNHGLLAMGVKNTKQLWEADAVTVARETGAPLSSVQSWQHMAELATIKDIGPQYAELLERSGVHSIHELKNYTPSALLKLVREKQNSLKVRIQGNFPGHATAKHWIHQARDHKFSVS